MKEEDKIRFCAKLAEYGINSIEEAAEKITKDAGLDVYDHDQRESSQSVLRTQNGLTL